MGSHARCVVFATMALAACGSDRLAATHEGLDFAPSTIHFPTTYLGHPTSRVVSLRNEGRVTRTATLHAPAPFALARERVDIGAGATEDVDLTFVPTKVGAFSGTVTVEFESATSSIDVDGEAKEAPVCSAATCEVVDFDPTTGQCVHRAAADGASCSEPCLDDGRCVSGVCHGVAKSCDDANVCTRDACDPNVGCVHDTIACVAPSDPCQVGVCDPARGCTSAPAPDGTTCGAVTCAGANLCFGGRCQLVPVPDGFACGSSSPCEDGGECHQGSCDAAPKRALAAEWTVPVVADQLDFTGTADDDGNVYWGERTGDVMTVVSYAADGVERWRTPLDAKANHFNAETMPGKLAVVGDFVVSTLTFDDVVALRRSDGAVAWETSVDDYYATDPSSGALELVDLGPLVSTDFGLVVRAERFDIGGGAVDLLRLDPATGVVEGSLAQGELASSTVNSDWYPAIGGSDLFVATSFGAQRQLFEVDKPDGSDAWQAPTDFLPDANVAGALFGALDFELGTFDLGTSTFIGSGLSAIDPWNVPVVASPGLAVFAGQVCNGDCMQPTGEVALKAFDPTTRQQRWTTTLLGNGTLQTEPVLLSGDDVLVGVTDVGDYADELLDLTSDGAQRFLCPLDNHDVQRPKVVLTHGRFIVASDVDGTTSLEVRGYAVPGLELGSRGFVAPFGSLARDGRAR